MRLCGRCLRSYQNPSAHDIINPQHCSRVAAPWESATCTLRVWHNVHASVADGLNHLTPAGKMALPVSGLQSNQCGTQNLSGWLFLLLQADFASLDLSLVSCWVTLPDAMSSYDCVFKLIENSRRLMSRFARTALWHTITDPYFRSCPYTYINHDHLAPSVYCP